MWFRKKCTHPILCFLIFHDDIWSFRRIDCWQRPIANDHTPRYSNCEHTVRNWGAQHSWFFFFFPPIFLPIKFAGMMPIFRTAVMWCLGHLTQWILFLSFLLYFYGESLSLCDTSWNWWDARALTVKVLRRFYFFFFVSFIFCLVNGTRNNLKRSATQNCGEKKRRKFDVAFNILVTLFTSNVPVLECYRLINKKTKTIKY